MKEVTNHLLQPVTLSDGTILATAGSAGSTKPVTSLSERDEKLVIRQMISAADKSLKAVSEASARTAAPRSAKDTTAATEKGGQD